MGDWPQVQEFDRQVLSTPLSVEAFALLNTPVFTTAWPAANLAIFVPVVVHQPFAMVKLFNLNGNTTVSGNIDMGVYDDQGYRIVSSGSTAQTPAAAVQTFDVTDTLLGTGVYYLALALDNTTGTIAAFTSAVPYGGTVGCLQMTSAFPLPSTASFAAHAVAVIPIMAMTSRTLI